MTHEYSFTYLTCQSCTARIHCEQCAQELAERLTGVPGITGAQLDIPNKRMAITTQSMDEMDLLDALEDMGIFAD